MFWLREFGRRGSPFGSPPGTGVSHLPSRLTNADAGFDTYRGGVGYVYLAVSESAAPHTAVCVLINGRPKTVYSTSWSLIDPTGNEVGRLAGPDAPFTTQIKRVNVFIPVLHIAPGYIVKAPGRFIVRLDVSGELVGETELMIIEIPKPAAPAE